MRQVDNWDNIEERQEGDFKNPPPGGYVVRIVSVKDDEAKEYLKLEWDYTMPPWAGFNEQTFNRAGFWPTTLFRSYKESALGFFKAFKTAVEQSNPGYTFDWRNPLGLQGKFIGVVLGEELYTAKNGEKKTRLYVAQTRSVQAIRDGDYEIPGIKDKTGDSSHKAAAPYNAPNQNPFEELEDDDADLPWGR